MLLSFLHQFRGKRMLVLYNRFSTLNVSYSLIPVEMNSKLDVHFHQLRKHMQHSINKNYVQQLKCEAAATSVNTHAQHLA